MQFIGMGFCLQLVLVNKEYIEQGHNIVGCLNKQEIYLIAFKKED